MNDKIQELIEKEESSTKRDLKGFFRYFSFVLGVGITAMIFYTAFYGVFLPKIQIGISLPILLALTFIWVPFNKKARLDKVDWYDIILVAVCLFITVYTVMNNPRFITRLPYASTVTILDIIVGISLVILVIEAVRRTTGMAMVVVVLTFILYSFFGPYLPSMFRHPGFTLDKFVDVTYLTTEGLFGSLVSLCVTTVFVFVSFGTFLEQTGGDKLFMDVALSVAGKRTGGPAKVAVLSSGLMAMLSGNAAANVVTTGTITIPMMKKYGFRPEEAGAVEAVASSGGQITPPVMGTVAFLIADTLGMSYAEVAKVSVLPALIFYITTWLFVDAKARKRGILGLTSVPKFWMSLYRAIPVIIPITFMIYMLMMKYTTFISGAVCTVSVVIVALFFKDSRINFKDTLIAMEKCAIGMTSMTGVMAAASIVVGIITKTGLLVKATSIIMYYSDGKLYLVVLFIMIMAYIAGMGLPSASCYIILAALSAPVLISLNVEPIAAHMMIFWFCQLAGLTPPVCIPAFVAAGIANANPMKTGFSSLMMGSSFYFIPIFFLITPLLTGTLLEKIISTIVIIAGVYFLVAALEGYLFKNLGKVSRIACGIVAMILFAVTVESIFIQQKIILFFIALVFSAIIILIEKKNTALKGID